MHCGYSFIALKKSLILFFYILGNKHIHKLTSQGDYELSIDLTDWDDKTTFAKYKHFVIGRESTNFVLGVSGYYGTAGT